MALRKLLGIICVAAACAAVQADTWITYTGVYGPDDVIGLKFNSGSTNLSYGGVVAGFLQFKDDSAQGLPNPFYAMCGDVIDEINSNDEYRDTIKNTSNFGSSGITVSAFTTDANIQAAGNIVAKDFDAVKALNSNDAAAGLQIAIWATVYDSAYATAHGVGLTGNAAGFQAMLTAGAGPLTVSGLNAATWTDAYLYWGDQGTSGNSLFLLHNGPGTGGPNDGNLGVQGQDQFTTTTQYHPGPTPEPFTMGLGIAGVALAIRRRLRAR